MRRRLFGARKQHPQPPPTDGWPELPDILEPIATRAGLMPMPAAPPAEETGIARSETQSEAELLERIAGFRAAVADSLLGLSQDYQILAGLMQADLEACSDIVAELNRRLAGNVHFRVLGKLDELHALVSRHLSAPLAARPAGEV